MCHVTWDRTSLWGGDKTLFDGLGEKAAWMDMGWRMWDPIEEEEEEEEGGKRQGDGVSSASLPFLQRRREKYTAR